VGARRVNYRRPGVDDVSDGRIVHPVDASAQVAPGHAV
jgi:hypothetical protein